MPIVFCASFEPWAKAIHPPRQTWSRRNPRVSGLRVACRKSQ